ncbi:homocysteine S-methyltransferase family protein [Alphaproteobacteria bacterium GH1-50]|uniref:Homocysteine S-methyltransferase family protein n=1 Tax=Kangsaoukella pontilimi TaxID=2691042 RepID=A0A7C9IP79_9RHOB|nr:homocysteine S-methyltransferase family protein [Kangsaoukella pontilimi]MXQ06683.1 homocysteine S-methyltransferase family protein [Kangsaoukella pontilimi]
MTGNGRLPQLDGRHMTCGGGFETWLQYVDGFELRHFCAFELLNDPRGRDCLADYHRKLVEAAVGNGFGVINEGLHYRASRDWGELIGFSREALEEINIRGIEFYRDFAREYESPETPMLVGGVIGPRGDAYNVGRTPDAAEAEEYHAEQIATFKKAGADIVTAATFSSVEEAIGLSRAAKAAGMPVVISFFVARGGRLKGGESLEEAIGKVDAATGNAPAYYMINCTHPTEFTPGLDDGAWTRRLGGFMPNAVAMETLDLCKLGHLEDGDPEELGGQMAELARRFPHINVWGGCCGTDGRHIGEITRQVAGARAHV